MEPLEIAGNNGNSSIRHLLVASTFILLLCQCSDESRDNMKTKPRNAEYSDLIQLPAPEIQKLPILRIISARRSAREFATVKLPKNVLSNLLYAAYGVNRPKTGRRTAPSTYNWQYIDVYVADDEALYLYDAFGNALKRIKTGDIRAQTGRQEYVATAPVNLIYVFDTKKWPDKDKDDQKALSVATTVGAIVENVYIFCAAQKLITVVREDFDKKMLPTEMNLDKTKEIVITQSVGYPRTIDRLKNWIKDKL